jgi:hypothetical protein
MCPFSAHRNATTVSGIVAPGIVSNRSKEVSPHNGQMKEGAMQPSLFYLSRTKPSLREGRLETTEKCVIDFAIVALSGTRHNAIIRGATIRVYSALREFPQASL